MPDHIHGSVGLGGRNRRDDTVAVQRRLVAAHCAPGMIDGVAGRRTVAAIVLYQGRFLSRPDGRIDVDGPTWRRLSRTQAPRSPAPPGPPAPARATAPAPAARPAPRVAPVAPPHSVAASPHAQGTSRFSELIPGPSRSQINPGVTSPSNRALIEKLGSPRQSFGSDCRPITNAKLKSLIVTENFGSFRATGLAPALKSLRAVMDAVRRDQPDLHGAIGTAGMLCCRYVRGSRSSISNHSWGTAIDLTINGRLDQPGNRKVQLGLSLLAPYFNAAGWYWGAAFGREDGMHFEVGPKLLSSFNI